MFDSKECKAELQREISEIREGYNEQFRRDMLTDAVKAFTPPSKPAKR